MSVIMMQKESKKVIKIFWYQWWYNGFKETAKKQNANVSLHENETPTVLMNQLNLILRYLDTKHETQSFDLKKTSFSSFDNFWVAKVILVVQTQRFHQ